LTRTIASAFLALALAAPALAAPAPESPGGRRPEYEASARAIAKAGPLEPFADLTTRWQYEGLRPLRSLTLGAYGRAHKNLKLGVFHRVQYGARHDDDWMNMGNGQWGWRGTGNRPENVLILDATPRTLLPFLPGKWTGSFKVRYEHNFFNGQRTLKLEPELAWFWLDGLSPKATVFLRHGTYMPLNFGQRGRFYERWNYLAGLWHFPDGISAGPSVALRDELWSTSADYRRASPGGESYRSLYRSLVYGLVLIVRP
jgi:hypothetical protein